jgi:hypothetical protein
VPPPDDKSYIDELKKSLYSRTAPDVRTRRKLRFSDSASNVQTDWEHPKDVDVRPVELNQEYKDHSMSFLTRLLIGSAVFCVLAVALGAYLFFNGSNLISANNIDIQISGPVSIPGGEPVSFDVLVANKNNVALQTVDMSVDFPDGTTDPADTAQALKNERVLIGDMPAGGTAHQTVKAVIFGEENLQKEITVTLTYGIKGSSSVFTKTQTYDVLINSSPLDVTVTSFNQITAGQPFDLTVNLKSNSQQVLKGIIVKAVYPFGYGFVSSNIPSLSDNATWKIGDMPPGSARSLVIHGTLSGADTDLRAFHFTVGAESSSDPKTIGTQYMAVEQDITIEKPFISLDIGIDNDIGAADHIGQFDQAERVTLHWFNNLPEAVSNVVIDAKLSGTAYDKTTVQPDQGYFDSGSDDIVWNQQSDPRLTSVAAGDSGTASFSITPKDIGGSLTNPTVSFSVSVKGDRTQESNVPQTVTAAVARSVKVASNVTLSGRIVRTNGPFQNTGPIPPKTEQATTYTVVWDVDNTSNPVSNAQVTAQLPAYVKWLGTVSPSAEDVTYDQNNGLVTWNVGSIGTYTLSGGNRKELAFQISLTPGANQVGQLPSLIGRSALTAGDTFTGAQLSSSQDPLTTRFSTDPAYQSGDEIVTR